MTITYEFSGSLYVNLTNRCSNACEFCVRNKHDDINGKDNLWLDREPTEEEIKEDFLRHDLDQYAEIVFCGYGEPTMRFDTMIVIAKWLKERKAEIRIRLNTNGHANLICKRDVTPELVGCIDILSISLNAENSEKYQQRCQSVFGGEVAFAGLLEFTRLATKYVPEVILSVVDVMDAGEIEACRELAKECGATFRVRKLIV